MLVFCPDAGVAEGVGDGAGEGGGPGSALTLPADAAQPAITSPATANLAATGTPALNPIEQQSTAVSSLFHIVSEPACKQ